MEDRVFAAALAGLLHDIGKIEQRAQEDPWRLPEGHERGRQPVHAIWTEYFIQHYVPKSYRPAAYQGVYHHYPEGSLAEDRTINTLVSLADKLSAGERADEQPEGGPAQPPQQLISIFNRVGTHLTQPTQAQYLPLRRLSLAEDAIFPTEIKDKKANLAAYVDLRDQLRAAAQVDTGDRETYLESLLSAFQQCTWSIPSAYYHSLPDVSLYDHSRMTAALAVCLSGFPSEKIQSLLDAVRKEFNGSAESPEKVLLEEPCALLVGGDISGIQNFIYTLSARGAAKTLRGRSFYLQLLTEAVLRYTLRELGLPYSNVIYSGGGHFYLLAPLSATQNLPRIQKYVTQTLLKHHGAGLYLALGISEISADGFRIGHFPTFWNQMHANLALAKQHRYQELGEELYPLVFKPIPNGGNRENTCSVCGEEKERTDTLDEEGESSRICSLCSSFADPLGRRLPNTRFVLLTLGEAQSSQPGTALDALAAFGMGVEWIENGAWTAALKLPSPQRAILWQLEDHIPQPVVKMPAAVYLRYMVNKIPEMTFDQLAKQSTGIERLGVLRMDVDDLGKLFQHGFDRGKDSIATLARVSSLSFQLSLFFEGWVKRVCEQTSPWIYAVYSGGDDLFLIAPWDIVPGLAQTIIHDFSRYTCANPCLHASAGMAFIHGKYPVYQAAEDTLNALESAKSTVGKNAFSFLGQSWKWTEFEQLTKNQIRLMNIVGKHNGPHSLLQVLQNLARMEAGVAQKTNNPRPLWGRWMWMGDYQLKRMIENTQNHKALASELSLLYQELSPLYLDIRIWGTSARWAQLLCRSKRDDSV